MSKPDPDPILSSNIIAEHLDWTAAEFDVNTVILKVCDKFAEKFLKRYNHPFEVTVLLTNNTEIQQLNRKFRHKDKATNVLSFPEHEVENGDLTQVLQGQGDTDASIYLGDVAMAWETMVEEAVNYGKTLESHFIHLLAHSLLHLIGYDHIKDNEAEVMMQHERLLLKNLGLKDPYIEYN